MSVKKPNCHLLRMLFWQQTENIQVRSLGGIVICNPAGWQWDHRRRRGELWHWPGPSYHSQPSCLTRGSSGDGGCRGLEVVIVSDKVVEGIYASFSYLTPFLQFEMVMSLNPLVLSSPQWCWATFPGDEDTYLGDQPGPVGDVCLWRRRSCRELQEEGLLAILIVCDLYLSFGDLLPNPVCHQMRGLSV